jgi:hypothetical protein
MHHHLEKVGSEFKREFCSFFVRHSSATFVVQGQTGIIITLIGLSFFCAKFSPLWLSCPRMETNCPRMEFKMRVLSYRTNEYTPVFSSLLS